MKGALSHQQCPAQPSPEVPQIPIPSLVLCSVQGPRSKSCQMSLGNLKGRAASNDPGAWERNEKLALHFKPVLNSQAPPTHSSASILVPMRTLRVPVRNLPGPEFTLDIWKLN